MDVPAFAAMQDRRRTLIERIEALSPELRTRAQGGQMSPLDLLDHLNLIDEMSLKTAKIEPGRGTRHLLFRPLVNRMRAGKNTPLPSMFKPKGGKSWEELKADSEANHLALADLVARAGEGDTIAHHPAFGTMTATQTCDLLDSHYEYHLKRFVEPV